MFFGGNSGPEFLASLPKQIIHSSSHNWQIYWRCIASDAIRAELFGDAIWLQILAMQFGNLGQLFGNDKMIHLRANCSVSNA
jgi:hypothetical protein